jgi:hypothetical protein
MDLLMHLFDRYRLHEDRPNQRDGVDAGWRLRFAFGCEWPGAAHRER